MTASVACKHESQESGGYSTRALVFVLAHECLRGAEATLPAKGRGAESDRRY